MMKKIAAVAAALGMLATLAFVGCKKKSSSSGGGYNSSFRLTM